MNIYEYILYHLYLILFLSYVKTQLFYSFILCLCNDEQFGEEAYSFFFVFFFAHVTIMV